MANGDAARAAGMDLVDEDDPIEQGYDEDNKTRDLIVEYATRDGPLVDIYVQASAPAHSPGRVWIKTPS